MLRGPGPRPPAVSLRPWISLGLLAAGYTLSFIDRTAVSVVQDKIKSELQLSDWQLGLMIGPAFAVFYSFSSVPLARIAELRNRSTILSVCILVWSAMTMACGLAQSFATMFLARMGVGIGEAGGNPASHSLIADLFPNHRRATAIAIYTLGAPAGTLLGAVVVGWLAQLLGWRQAFLLLGVPGIMLALLIWTCLKEPERGAYEVVPASSAAPPGFMVVVGGLWRNSAFRHLVWGGSLVVLVGYCVAAFLPALLSRQYHLPLSQIGAITGLVAGLGGGIGTMLGGAVADRWAASNLPRLAMFAAGAVLPAPFLLAGGLLSDSLLLLVAGSFLGTVAIYGYVAPAFTQVHHIATSQSRATVTSIYFLITNLIGLGIGPPLVGAISDHWARQKLALDADAFADVCLRATSLLDCGPALAEGMQIALLTISVLPAVAAVHFLVAARRYRQARTK